MWHSKGNVVLVQLKLKRETNILSLFNNEADSVLSVYVTHRTLQKDTELVSDVDNDSCTGLLGNMVKRTIAQRYSHYLKKTEKER